MSPAGLLRGWWSAARHNCVDEGQEFADINRLGEVIVRAGGAEAIDLRGSGIGADYDHGNGLGARIGTQLPKDLVSLNIGEVEIDEDEVVLMLAGEFKPDAALHRRDQLHPRPPG